MVGGSQRRDDGLSCQCIGNRGAACRPRSLPCRSSSGSVGERWVNHFYVTQNVNSRGEQPPPQKFVPDRLRKNGGVTLQVRDQGGLVVDQFRPLRIVGVCGPKQLSGEFPRYTVDVCRSINRKSNIAVAANIEDFVCSLRIPWVRSPPSSNRTVCSNDDSIFVEHQDFTGHLVSYFWLPCVSRSVLLRRQIKIVSGIDPFTDSMGWHVLTSNMASPRCPPRRSSMLTEVSTARHRPIAELYVAAPQVHSASAMPTSPTWLQSAAMCAQQLPRPR